QPVHVAVANRWLAVLRGPSLRRAIEVQLAREHRVVLYRVEEMRVARQVRPQTSRRGKVRMGRDDEAVPVRIVRLEPREIGERVQLVGAALEVQEQDVFAFDRALDTADQQNAALGGVRLD